MTEHKLNEFFVCVSCKSQLGQNLPLGRLFFLKIGKCRENNKGITITESTRTTIKVEIYSATLCIGIGTVGRVPDCPLGVGDEKHLRASIEYRKFSEGPSSFPAVAARKCSDLDAADTRPPVHATERRSPGVLWAPKRFIFLFL